MNQKELTIGHLMISNCKNPLISTVCTSVLQLFEGQNIDEQKKQSDLAITD